MAVHSFIHGLWISSIALQAVLAMVVLTKRLWNRFPFFSAYVVASLLELVVAYVLRTSGPVYVRFYWTAEAITLLLGLGIAYEIFRKIFIAHPALRRIAAILFGAAVVALVALGIFVVEWKTPSGDKSLTSAILVIAEATRILEVGLVMFLFLFSTAFGLHWRQATFGIALGLGIIATVELMAVTMQSELGSSALSILNLARTSGFNFTLLIWLGYILAPERTAVMALPERSQLEQWNRAVMELIHQ
jgi:hypothetical protein